MKKQNKQAGFTLIELLVVIGIIAILAAIVIIAINPARQFAQARDTQRRNDVTAILNAIGQRMADNDGLWDCTGATLSDTAQDISSAGFDMWDCIVPDYISTMPMDPSTGTGSDSSSYDTGYQVVQDATSDRITVSATPEVAATVDVTR